MYSRFTESKHEYCRIPHHPQARGGIIINSNNQKVSFWKMIPGSFCPLLFYFSNIFCCCRIDGKAWPLNTLMNCYMWQSTQTMGEDEPLIFSKVTLRAFSNACCVHAREAIDVWGNLQPYPWILLFSFAILATTGKAQRWAGLRMEFLSRPWDWVGERFYMMISLFLPLWKKKRKAVQCHFWSTTTECRQWASPHA